MFDHELHIYYLRTLYSCCGHTRLIRFGIYLLFSINLLHSHPDVPGFEVIKLFSCSTQLSLKFILLINVKMPTIVGIFSSPEPKAHR